VVRDNRVEVRVLFGASQAKPRPAGLFAFSAGSRLCRMPKLLWDDPSTLTTRLVVGRLSLSGGQSRREAIQLGSSYARIGRLNSNRLNALSPFSSPITGLRHRACAREADWDTPPMGG
jgi:hypothetical protein